MEKGDSFSNEPEDPEKVTELKRMKRGEREEDSPPLALALCPSLAALESLSWEHPPPVQGDQASGRAAGRTPEMGLGKVCLLFQGLRLSARVPSATQTLFQLFLSTNKPRPACLPLIKEQSKGKVPKSREASQRRQVRNGTSAPQLLLPFKLMACWFLWYILLLSHPYWKACSSLLSNSESNWRLVSDTQLATFFNSLLLSPTALWHVLSDKPVDCPPMCDKPFPAYLAPQISIILCS